MISLRSAGYIREAETFGYPVGDGGEIVIRVEGDVPEAR